MGSTREEEEKLTKHQLGNQLVAKHLLIPQNIPIPLSIQHRLPNLAKLRLYKSYEQ